ncbi:MAG: tRNA pseudouridine(38-40) synthase TruA [Flammeovirgaceae bacterium]|nr:tRNA pseudouridine(38-40) synthase TruA [Flammeovirgaceae bacterium]
MRYFLEVAYHGANFHGWQVQDNAKSVQGELNDKLSKLLREDIFVYGSGRTDTGVHCSQQFAHFDVSIQFNLKDLQHRLNAFLNEEISILSIRPVKPEAHARFDAISRAYVYKIVHQKNPFSTGLAYFFPHQLDLGLMNKAASLLLHYTDYQAFCKTRVAVNNYHCSISEAYWKSENGRTEFHIKANRFLRGMVRLLTGAMLQVGSGKLSIQGFEEKIQSKSQNSNRYAAPAHGLYLCRVLYPEEIFLVE